MPLRLIEASTDKVGVMARLAQLYKHDMSEFDGVEPELDGSYPVCGILDDDGCENHLIALRGRPAGFLSYKETIQGDTKSITLKHFFIVRSYRRLGIGEEVARILFDQLPGKWVIEVPETNEVATIFFRHVVMRYTFRHFRELNSGDGSKRIFEFVAKTPDAFE